MLKEFRRRRQIARVRPGDGSALQDYRFWQLFSRSLFVLDHPAGSDHRFEVDVRLTADSTTRRSPASLYRDGVQVARANVPVAFPVPGGVIEVATSQYGVKRTRYVGDDGRAQALSPHPRSPEGLRARFDRRFPRTSAVIGAVGLVVLLVGLAVTLSTVAEQVTRVEVVAQHLGTFTSPITLPGWAKLALPAAGAVAAIDRALRLKSTWMAD
jgi:hypothetical protein